mgnify:CR=1 FL=1
MVSFKDGYLAFWNQLDNMEIFSLLQFHFHSPSDHTFNGKNYDLEMHIVHKDLK